MSSSSARRTRPCAGRPDRRANGVADIDPLRFFGYELTTRTQQYFFLLGTVVVVLAALHFLSESRTGRAWRAPRGSARGRGDVDPRQPPEADGVRYWPAIAGLAAIFASVLTAVSSSWPADPDHDLRDRDPRRIGSLTGVVIGAIVINISFQFLAPENPQSNARVLFFFVLALVLVLSVRPRWLGAALVGAVIVFGFVTQAIVEAVAPSWTGGNVTEGGRLAEVVGHWVVIPQGHADFGNVAYVTLVVAVLALTQMHGWWRTAALVPTVYLAAIVWETSFVEQPQVARWILFDRCSSR